MEIINGEYVLNEEESYNLLHNKVNRLNPYDEKIQSFIDSIDLSKTSKSINFIKVDIEYLCYL